MREMLERIDNVARPVELALLATINGLAEEYKNNKDGPHIVVCGIVVALIRQSLVFEDTLISMKIPDSGLRLIRSHAKITSTTLIADIKKEMKK